MRHLRLVQWDEVPPVDKAFVCGVFESIERIIDGDVDRSTYGREKLLSWYVNTNEGQMRFVFDPLGTCKSRQGQHFTVSSDWDEYRAVDLLGEAFADNFDTVWLHV